MYLFQKKRMSLSLQESCQMYERQCRRQKKTVTFAQFNSAHFTCLPSNDKVETSFNVAVTKARRAEGVPIISRLPSLFRSLTGCASPPQSSMPSSVVLPVQNSMPVSVPSYDDAMRMNIRPPQAVEGERKEGEFTLEEYVEMVKASPIQEKKGLIVHFAPSVPPGALSSLASKLTKNTWEVLRGQKNVPLKMKDGSEFDLNLVELNVNDVKQFVSDRKKKKEGPFFIRFSRI